MNQDPKTVPAATNPTIFDRIYPLGFRDEALIIVKNSVPLVLSILTNVLFQMMSMFFCGHLGPNELAGVSLAGTFINVLCNSLLIGTATASDTLMPQLFGSSKKKNVGIILQKGCIISFMLSIICVGLIINTKNLMTFIIDDYEVLKHSYTFTIYFSPSILFTSQQVIIQRYLQAQNYLYPVLAINIGTTVLNAVLHFIFISLLGFGVKGSAIVLSIVSAVQVAAFIIYILFKKIYKVTWPGLSLECLYDWKVYLNLGLAGMTLMVLDWAFFEIAMVLISTLGSSNLSVMAISLQTLFLFFVIPYGIGYSGNIRVGQLLGENRPYHAINAAKVVITVSLVVSFCVGLLILILSNQIPYAFTGDDQVAELSFPIMKFFSVVVMFDGLQICGFGLMRSVGAQRHALIIAFFGFYIISSGIGYPLLFKTDLQVLGFWIGYCVGALSMFIAHMVYVYRLDWVKIAQVAHNSEMMKNRQQQEPNDEMTINETNQIDNGVKKSIKSKMIKKGLLFFTILVIFIVLFSVKDLREIRPKSFSNDTDTTTSTKPF